MNKKWVTNILFTALGVLLGATLVLVFNPSSVEKIEEAESKNVVIVEKDTVKKKPVNKKKVVVEPKERKDSTIYIIDSLVLEDTLLSDEVLTESILATKNLKVGPPEEVDSTAILLDVFSPVYSTNMQVEFWHSPLQLTGYELSKSKLKLFGFDPDQQIAIFERKDKGLAVYLDNELHVFYKSDKFTALEE